MPYNRSVVFESYLCLAGSYLTNASNNETIRGSEVATGSNQVCSACFDSFRSLVITNTKTFSSQQPITLSVNSSGIWIYIGPRVSYPNYPNSLTIWVVCPNDTLSKHLLCVHIIKTRLRKKLFHHLNRLAFVGH